MRLPHRAKRATLPVGVGILLAFLAFTVAVSARPAVPAVGTITPEVAWTAALPPELSAVPLVEPILVVDPSDPERLVGAAMAVEGGGGLRSVVFVSRDGGRTWSVGRNVGSGDAFFPDGDPTVAVGPDGTAYLSTLEDGFAVWRASGDTLWHRVGRVPGGQYDRQWLAFDLSGGPHHGRLHTAGKILIQVTGSMARDVAAFSWSDDRGETFRDPTLVLPDPSTGSLNIVSHLAVLPDGSVVAPYAFLHWPRASDPPVERAAGALRGELAVLRSDDGRHWEEPVTIGPKRMWGHGDQLRMIKGLGAGGLVVAPESSGPEVLHTTWPDIHDGWIQVVAATSTDGGRTWSEPVRVNRGGRASNASNPGIAVDGRGHVAVIWNDRRDDPEDRCFRPFLAVSADRGASFGPEIPLTDEPVCPGPGRWMNGGDTQGIVGLPDGGFQAVWVGPGTVPGVAFGLRSTRINVP